MKNELGFISWFGIIVALTLLWFMAGQFYAVRGESARIAQREQNIRLRLAAESVMLRLKDDIVLPPEGSETNLGTENLDHITAERYVRGLKDGALLAVRAVSRKKPGGTYIVRCFKFREGTACLWL